MRFVRVFVMLAALPATAAAHHGIINFDMNREIDIAGVVSRFTFVNPHSWLHVDVTGTDGRVTEWRCELRGATVLRRSGWSQDMFARVSNASAVGCTSILASRANSSKT